jgi:hypothetical protein
MHRLGERSAMAVAQMTFGYLLAAESHVPKQQIPVGDAAATSFGTQR